MCDAFDQDCNVDVDDNDGRDFDDDNDSDRMGYENNRKQNWNAPRAMMTPEMTTMKMIIRLMTGQPAVGLTQVALKYVLAMVLSMQMGVVWRIDRSSSLPLILSRSRRLSTRTLHQSSGLTPSMQLSRSMVNENDTYLD